MKRILGVSASSVRRHFKVRFGAPRFRSESQSGDPTGRSRCFRPLRTVARRVCRPVETDRLFSVRFGNSSD
ncbi:hypothetical protein AOLI_G00177060 [Acnodon oligacanthus]